MEVSSPLVRLAISRDAGKLFGVTLRDTFRRELLIVREETETADTTKVSNYRYQTKDSTDGV